MVICQLNLPASLRQMWLAVSGTNHQGCKKLAALASDEKCSDKKSALQIRLVCVLCDNQLLSCLVDS